MKYLLFGRYIAYQTYHRWSRQRNFDFTDELLELVGYSCLQMATE
jgi:hypothetical protein